MSRIGRKPIAVPEKVKVDVHGNAVKVSGPLGELNAIFPPEVPVTVDKGVIHVGAPKPTRQNRGYMGLVRALLANMVKGVTKGYEKKLEINGVGYKCEAKGETLVFALGYSHPIEFTLPKGVKAKVEKQTQITLTGVDRQAVGQAAAQIRSFRKPEPYKGKGVKYSDETIRRKVGKAGVK
ncbi:MAG: 50S ribosomal protein L6 [Deltaproteobacteria bacterium]|nr:50S ribosomal protein L6 [Deltaproteobacteria bacterium]